MVICVTKVSAMVVEALLLFTRRISAQYINLSLDNALVASMEPSDKNNIIYNMQ